MNDKLTCNFDLLSSDPSVGPVLFHVSVATSKKGVPKQKQNAERGSVAEQKQKQKSGLGAELCSVSVQKGGKGLHQSMHPPGCSARSFCLPSPLATTHELRATCANDTRLRQSRQVQGRAARVQAFREQGVMGTELRGASPVAKRSGSGV